MVLIYTQKMLSLICCSCSTKQNLSVEGQSCPYGQNKSQKIDRYAGCYSLERKYEKAAIASLINPALSEPQRIELFAKLIINYARNVLQSWRRTKGIYESRTTYGKCEFNKTLGDCQCKEGCCLTKPVSMSPPVGFN